MCKNTVILSQDSAVTKNMFIRTPLQRKCPKRISGVQSNNQKYLVASARFTLTRCSVIQFVLLNKFTFVSILSHKSFQHNHWVGKYQLLVPEAKRVKHLVTCKKKKAATIIILTLAFSSAATPLTPRLSLTLSIKAIDVIAFFCWESEQVCVWNKGIQKLALKTHKLSY